MRVCLTRALAAGLRVPPNWAKGFALALVSLPLQALSGADRKLLITLDMV
jgi:hypothetical protein